MAGLKLFQTYGEKDLIDAFHHTLQFQIASFVLIIPNII
jgi:hypothetical protein